MGAHRTAASLRDLVAFELKHPAFGGQEQHIVVGRADKHFLDNVLVLLLHAGNAPAAPLLDLIDIGGLAFDIAFFRQGDHAVFPGDQVLDVHFPGNGLDVGAALVAEFLLDLQKLLGHDFHNLIVVAQNFLHFGNAGMEAIQFFLDF